MKPLRIHGDDLVTNKRWHAIAAADYELKHNTFPQHIELMLPYVEEEIVPGRYGEFLDLMLHGPDPDFVKALAAMMPIQPKRRWKPVMASAGGEIRMEEVIDTSWG